MSRDFTICDRYTSGQLLTESAPPDATVLFGEFYNAAFRLRDRPSKLRYAALSNGVSSQHCACDNLLCSYHEIKSAATAAEGLCRMFISIVQGVHALQRADRGLPSWHDGQPDAESGSFQAIFSLPSYTPDARMVGKFERIVRAAAWARRDAIPSLRALLPCAHPGSLFPARGPQIKNSHSSRKAHR